jgi:hypothetical protein
MTVSGKLAAAAAVATLLSAVLNTSGPGDDKPIYESQIDDSAKPQVNVSATLEHQHKLISSSNGSAPTDTVYWRASPALCLLSDLTGFVTELAAACREGEQLAYEAPECPDGYALPALFRAERLPSGNLSTAQLVSDAACVTPADLVAAAAQAFASLPIEPSPLHVQPPDGWTLINVDTITYTEDAPQEFATDLLGVPVTIRAVPSTFAWSFGDGTAPLVTEHPGAPYPDHTVGHTYTAPGEVTIGLATTWRGQFQITGTPTWTDVPGEATTSTTSPTITVHEARTRLVEGPAG